MINDTTELTAAQELIGRLTFDIGCMKADLDAERKSKSNDIECYREWLDRVIELETTHPTGPSNAHVFEECKRYFVEMVAK
jgi:hypothetical protein